MILTGSFWLLCWKKFVALIARLAQEILEQFVSSDESFSEEEVEETADAEEGDETREWSI